MVAAVETRRLTRRFRRRFRRGTEVVALSNLTLTIPARAFIALTGPNGAGKTTLLEILSTLLWPSSGEVRVCGLDPVREGLAVRRMVGYCPAGRASFWPRLTGRENLDCFAALAGVAGPDAGAHREDVLARVGLGADVADRETRTYSDGETQRLNLARLLLRDAPVWLLDEPTRSLDPAGQAAMWALVRQTAQARGATVIAATHDVAGVAAVADDVVALP